MLGEPLWLLRPWSEQYLDSKWIDSTCLGGYHQISTKLHHTYCTVNTHGLMGIWEQDYSNNGLDLLRQVWLIRSIDY